MIIETMPGALSAGMADMLRVLLTAVGVAAAGCLIWAVSSFFQRKRKKRGRNFPQNEDEWRGGPRPR